MADEIGRGDVKKWDVVFLCWWHFLPRRDAAHWHASCSDSFSALWVLAAEVDFSDFRDKQSTIAA